MYIFSFLKALFKPSKILTSIYLVLNMGLVFGMFYLFKLFAFGTELDGVYNGLIGIGINFACLLVALTPMGEMYFRFISGIKRMARTSENEHIFQAFEEVYQKAKEVNPKLSKKIRLYCKKDKDVNAYALGHRTVCLTEGAMKLDIEHIKGMLAHEFGHIAHADSDLTLGIVLSNMILGIFVFIVKLIATLMILIVGVATRSKVLTAIMSFIFITIIMTVFQLWTKIGMLMMNATSRGDEYLADKFAVECGYGCELSDALSTIDPSLTKSSVVALLSSTHPDTVTRVEKISILMNNNTCKTVVNDSVAVANNIEMTNDNGLAQVACDIDNSAAATSCDCVAAMPNDDEV